MNSDGIARPNPALTPGAAVPGVSVEQVCAPGYASTSRNPGLLDEQSVFQLYLLDYPASLSGYRVDRLIPTELGGADTLPNLWPEPTTPQTAGRKDQLTGWLHQLVCSDAVPLETAQRQVADDWYAAWLRYGGTNSPAPDTLTAVGAPSPPAALGAPSGAAAVGAAAVGARPSAAAGRAPATGAPAVPSVAGAAAVGTVAAPSGPAAPVTAAGAPAPSRPASTSPTPSPSVKTTPPLTTPVPTTTPAPPTTVSPTPTQTPATQLIAPTSSAITPPTAPAPSAVPPSPRSAS